MGLRVYGAGFGLGFRIHIGGRVSFRATVCRVWGLGLKGVAQLQAFAGFCSLGVRAEGWGEGFRV